MHTGFCGCNIPPKLYRCMVCHGPKHTANLTLKSTPAVPKAENPFLPLQPSMWAPHSLTDSFGVLQLCLGASKAVSPGGGRVSTTAFCKHTEDLIVWVKEFGIKSLYVHVGPYMPLKVLQMGNFNFQMIIIFGLDLKEMWDSMLMISCKCIYLLEVKVCWMKGQLGLSGCFTITL